MAFSILDKSTQYMSTHSLVCVTVCYCVWVKLMCTHTLMDGTISGQTAHTQTQMDKQMWTQSVFGFQDVSIWKSNGGENVNIARLVLPGWGYAD